MIVGIFFWKQKSIFKNPIFAVFFAKPAFSDSLPMRSGLPALGSPLPDNYHDYMAMARMAGGY